MVSCSRCYLHRSIRVVNFVINAIGVAMIVYSLWLLKKWKDGVDELDLASPVPTPWFIYTCLGVGIVVCLSTLLGHSIANCISNSLLAVYIVSICSLLLVQAVIIVTVFYKTNWEMQISIYIDENHEEFKNFVLFHVEMCCLISISVLVAQLIVALLAGILWAVGCEPNLHCSSSDPPNFTYSFLDDRTSSLSDCTRLPERSFQVHNIGQTLRNSFA
ncbi:tetraspanin-19-like isoform X1 [Coffea eugenioides]|uniref:tetraspanin-19-like isoform X1 n=1 Tax=Coffea eugenioides TaxID=49369 RepID=UPI000F608A9B|nr:tetraspanin-19-like isoform X1 [Coffea eugenioides]